MKPLVIRAAALTFTAIASAQAVSGELADMDADAQMACFVKNRQVRADDPYRPLYHFSPPGFGTHDAAGLCWWQGKYHLFYLLSVPGVQWARGHAVSDDLVHWRDRPMLPKGIHGGTGQVWVDRDRVILAVAGSKVATASDPLLLNWTEHAVHTGGDNYLWRDGDFYYLTRPAGGRNTTLALLRSKDMTQWQSLGLYLEDGYFTDPGTDCACPNVLSLGNGKHLILFFSHNQGPKYYLGRSDLQQGRFTIEKHGRMNYGPVMRGSLHAPSGFVDPKGRCIGMWNIFECVIKEDFCGTKNGVMSLPRHLVRVVARKMAGQGGWKACALCRRIEMPSDHWVTCTRHGPTCCEQRRLATPRGHSSQGCTTNGRWSRSALLWRCLMIISIRQSSDDVFENYSRRTPKRSLELP